METEVLVWLLILSLIGVVLAYFHINKIKPSQKKMFDVVRVKNEVKELN